MTIQRFTGNDLSGDAESVVQAGTVGAITIVVNAPSTVQIYNLGRIGTVFHEHVDVPEAPNP